MGKINSASEMTYIVSGGALNSTHSLMGKINNNSQIFVYVITKNINRKSINNLQKMIT